MGDTVSTGRRAGLAALIAVAVSLPARALAQSGTPTEDVMVLPLHPSTPTSVQFSDAIVDARILHRGEFLMEIVGQSINLRPRPDTPAGTEAVVEVETRTLRRRFRLRVVERPEDAVQTIVLHAVETVKRTAEARQDVAPVVPAEPEPAASAPARAATLPAPVVLQPQAGHEPAPEPTRESAEPITERASPAAASRAFDLSVHALVSLGVTSLDVPGYEPDTTRQHHGGLGLRLTLAPHDKPLALEASISGERLAGPMAYTLGDSQLEVSGPWLRAELGIRAQFGTRWIPSVYAGSGLQAQLRRTEETASQRLESIETLNRGAVLALGMGLQYRARGVLLGLDFQVRQAWPDDYFSVAAFLTFGRILEQGE